MKNIHSLVACLIKSLFFHSYFHEKQNGVYISRTSSGQEHAVRYGARFSVSYWKANRVFRSSHVLNNFRPFDYEIEFESTLQLCSVIYCTRLVTEILLGLAQSIFRIQPLSLAYTRRLYLFLKQLSLIITMFFSIKEGV